MAWVRGATSPPLLLSGLALVRSRVQVQDLQRRMATRQPQVGCHCAVRATAMCHQLIAPFSHGVWIQQSYQAALTGTGSYMHGTAA